MVESQSELASKYRKRADHYRELAAVARNAEMRMAFLQAVAAFDQAAAIADFKASQERRTVNRG